MLPPRRLKVENQQQYQERLEKEGLEMAEQDYGFKKSPEELLQKEKVILKKRLLEIQEKEGIPKMKQEQLAKELNRRRLRFKELQHEKQVNNQMIHNSFSDQETHTDFKTGKIITGIQ